jgi:XPG I-region.
MFHNSIPTPNPPQTCNKLPTSLQQACNKLATSLQQTRNKLATNSQQTRIRLATDWLELPHACDRLIRLLRVEFVREVLLGGCKMGINNLWEILKQKGCGEEMTLAELRERVVVDGRCCFAADAYVAYYKYYCTAWKYSVEGNFSVDGIVSDCVKKLDDMSKNLKRQGIDLLWCVDGKHDKNKLATERRVGKRDAKTLEIAEIHRTCLHYCEMNPETTLSESRLLSQYDFLREHWPTGSVKFDEDFDLQRMIADMRKDLAKYPIMFPGVRKDISMRLESMGHRFLSVPEISEGEKLCSITVKIGLCQAVLSTDGDLIPMGTRCVVKEIKYGIATVFTHHDIITKLGITYEQLMSLSIILGNDFNEGIPLMGKVKCFDEIMKPDFDIYKFDREHCGVLRVNTCLSVFSISEQECRLVEDVITNNFPRQY